MILYHGSNINFNNIDLNKCINKGDFGRGFYLSVGKNHAILAGRKKLNKGTGSVFIYSYDFIDSNLNILNLYNIDINWLKTVIVARLNDINKFDVIAGATADADANYIIKRLSINRINLMSNDELYMLIDNLKPHVYPKQMCFKTVESLKYLKPVDKYELKFYNYNLVNTIKLHILK